MSGGDIFVSFGGDTAGLEATVAVAKASVHSFTSDLSKLAAQMSATGATVESELGEKVLAAAGKLSEAKARLAELNAELKASKGAGEGLASVREGAATAAESLKHLGEIAGIVLSIDAFKEWVESSAELGEKMERLSAQLGATIPQVSELAGLAKLTGTDFDGLVLSVERMQLKLTQAGRESSATGQALHVLGISAREFAVLPIPQQLERLAEAFSRFGDGPTKTAAALALLGRNGAEMLPYLDRGKEGLDELREVLARTGAVMSTQMAQSFGRTKEDLSELSLAWQGLSNRLFQVVNGPIDLAIKGLTKLIESMDVGAVRSGVSALTGASIDLVTSIRIFALNAADALDTMMGKIREATTLFEKLYNVETATLKVALNPAGAAADLAVKGFERLRDLSKDISDALTGGGTKGLGALGAGITPLETKINDLRGAAMMLKKEMNDAMGGGERPGGRAGHEETSGLGGGKPQVPPMDTTGQRGRAAAQDFDADVQKARDAAALIEDKLNEELKTHQITMAQWVTQTVGALETERSAIEAAAQHELATARHTADEKKAIRDKEAHDLAQIALQEQKAWEKAAEQSAQQWKAAADQIAGAINGQVSGLLHGTTTLKEAFRNMAASMIEDIIKVFIKWAAEQAAMVVMNAVLGKAAASAGAAPAISADIGQAYAGFAAFFAPTLGPGAPAAAAGLAAEVGTTATAMAAFDVGSWQLPSDMTARVHQGEMIVPAAQTPWVQSLLSNGGGGGATHNWNIAVNGSNLSPQLIVAAIRHNVSAIAQTLAREANMNPSSRPAY